MTLSTNVRIIGEVSPEGLFAKCREIIGIPQEHPFDVERGGFFGDGWVTTWSAMGGFRSMLIVGTSVCGPADPGSRWHDDEYCDDDCTCLNRTPPCNAQVHLDTTYGYRGPEGGCSDVHREITARLGEWLTSIGCDWWAQDEFTGEWHHRTPCPVR